MDSNYYTFQADLTLGTEDGDSYRNGAYKQDKQFQRSQFSPSGRYLMQAVTVETRSEIAIHLRITDFIAQTYHHYVRGYIPVQSFRSPVEIVCCYWTDEDTIDFGSMSPARMKDGNLIGWSSSTLKLITWLKELGVLAIQFIVVGDKQSLCLVPFYYGFAEIIYIDYPKNYGVHYSVEDPVYVHENKVFFQTNKKGKECANEMLYLDLNNLNITVGEHELKDFKKAVFKDKGYQPSFIKSRRKNSVQCGRYVIRWAGDLKNRDTELYIVDLKDLRITQIDARIAGFDCPTILNDSLLMFRNITAPRVGVPLEDMQYISIPNVVSYSKGTVVRLCTAALNAVLMSDAYDVEERELCHKLCYEGVVI